MKCRPAKVWINNRATIIIYMENATIDQIKSLNGQI